MLKRQQEVERAKAAFQDVPASTSAPFPVIAADALDAPSASNHEALGDGNLARPKMDENGGNAANAEATDRVASSMSEENREGMLAFPNSLAERYAKGNTNYMIPS